MCGCVCECLDAGGEAWSNHVSINPTASYKDQNRDHMLSIHDVKQRLDKELSSTEHWQT